MYFMKPDQKTKAMLRYGLAYGCHVIVLILLYFVLRARGSEVTSSKIIENKERDINLGQYVPGGQVPEMQAVFWAFIPDHIRSSRLSSPFSKKL